MLYVKAGDAPGSHMEPRGWASACDGIVGRATSETALVREQVALGIVVGRVLVRRQRSQAKNVLMKACTDS